MSSSSSSAFSDCSSSIDSSKSDYDEAALQFLCTLENLRSVTDISFQSEPCSSTPRRLLTSDTPIAECRASSTANSDYYAQETIWSRFLGGRSQWIDEPIINSWHIPSMRIQRKAETVDRLYVEWSRLKPEPFKPLQ